MGSVKTEGAFYDCAEGKTYGAALGVVLLGVKGISGCAAAGTLVTLPPTAWRGLGPCCTAEKGRKIPYRCRRRHHLRRLRGKQSLEGMVTSFPRLSPTPRRVCTGGVCAHPCLSTQRLSHSPCPLVCFCLCHLLRNNTPCPSGTGCYWPRRGGYFVVPPRSPCSSSHSPGGEQHGRGAVVRGGACDLDCDLEGLPGLVVAWRRTPLLIWGISEVPLSVGDMESSSYSHSCWRSLGGERLGCWESFAFSLDWFGGFFYEKLQAY